MKKLSKIWIAAVLAFAFTVPAFAATCTSQMVWTNLGPPGSVNFGQTFGASGSYADCYTFTLGGAANSSGTTLENNLLFDKLFLDVTSVSLFAGGTVSGSTVGSALFTDTTPDVFSFANLGVSTYTFVVSSTVYKSLGLYTSPVGYTGTMKTVAGTTAAVPEPASIALLGLGLLGLGFARRKVTS